MSFRSASIIDSSTVVPNLARVRAKQTDDVLEQHAFTRAAGADDDQAFARFDCSERSSSTTSRPKRL